jgi:transposase InsO family protein
MSHRNAPLSVEGRRRLVQRCRHRPIAHVAAEMGISRACASKWVNRWRRHGELGLVDRSSAPHSSPAATPAAVVAQIETWRRQQKWSATRITYELGEAGFSINRRTVTRQLARLGLGQRRFVDPCGEANRKPGTIIARWPGHMVHLDVKKVGRIPDGGGWRIHGRGSAQAKAVNRTKTVGAKPGYVYLHSAIDGFSRLAYTEPLADEKGATAAAFLARAKVWFAAHGITHLHRVVTDNGACYRSADFARIIGAQTRHQKTKPFTPKHNGKAERYQRILAEELLYAREFTGEDDRSAAISVWNIHYNYHRPHSAAGGQPPASRLHTGVTNLQPSYS